jgi:hypothetical protein
MNTLKALILTSDGDFVYGENLYDFTTQHADPALWVYGVPTSQALQWLVVRYATVALEFYGSGACGSIVHSVNNCSLFNCLYGTASDAVAISVNNSTCCQVSTPMIGYGCSSQGTFTTAYPPTLTTWPSSQCQFVLPTYSSVTFNAAATPSTCSYTWVLWNGPAGKHFPIVGTSQSLTLSPATLGTAYGGHEVSVYVTDAYKTTVSNGWVGIVDQSAMDVANHWATYTNSKTCSLWSSRPTTDPPTGLAWDTTCLLYGKTGFTAISQCSQFAPRGQMPVTLLTPRHGYTRGHGAGTPDNEPFHDLNSHFNGSNVYFCTASGTLVTATVTNAYTRCWGSDGLDYTILIFNAGLPPTIQPMEVTYSPPTYYSVVFNTAQSGYMTANHPPFWGSYAPFGISPPIVAAPDAFPPFNQYPTFLADDSGSPSMVPETDDVLVFLYGDTTTGPCPQMQTDMDTLSTSVGCTLYRMTQYRY